MKKLYVLFISIFLIGCGSIKDLSNTPTKKVEEYLNKYQIVDDSVFKDISDDIKDLFDKVDLTENEKNKYEKVMRQNYGNMTYEIKDERIDGNSATVTVEINVIDIAKVKKDADEYLNEHNDEFKDETGVFNNSLFYNYLFERLEKNSEIITYTIDFTLMKKNNGEWKLDTITKEQKQKLHGTYGM